MFKTATAYRAEARLLLKEAAEAERIRSPLAGYYRSLASRALRQAANKLNLGSTGESFYRDNTKTEN